MVESMSATWRRLQLCIQDLKFQLVQEVILVSVALPGKAHNTSALTLYQLPSISRRTLNNLDPALRGLSLCPLNALAVKTSQEHFGLYRREVEAGQSAAVLVSAMHFPLWLYRKPDVLAFNSLPGLFMLLWPFWMVIAKMTGFFGKGNRLGNILNPWMLILW